MSKDMNKNIILIDWLSFTCRNMTKFDCLKLLQLDNDINFELQPGFYGYRYRLHYGGISIYYEHGKLAQDYPMVEFSGQGCRTFETYSKINFDVLLNLCINVPQSYHITRIDIAYDDHTGILNIDKIVHDTLYRNFVGKLLNGMIVDSFKREIDCWSVMFGVKSSDLYIRIYDKARERKINDGRHWIRCETVFKQDRALEFIKNSAPIGEKLRGVLQNYLRFVTPNNDDCNKRRWNTRKYWADFLGDVNKISVYTPKDVEYNLSRISRFVFKQAGNSIHTFIKCQGLTAFLEKVLGRGTRLTKNQKSLIDSYAREMECRDVISADFVEEFQKSGVYKL